ncbi:MAG: EcsC family protein [Roseiflexaceae bacterium]
MMNADAEQSSKALEFAHGILQESINGNKMIPGAFTLAEQYAKSYANADDAVDGLIRWQSSWNFTTGFVAGLGGLITLPVTIPFALLTSWVIQTRMVATIAALYGHSLHDEKVRMAVLMTIAGDSAKEAAKEVGVTIGKKVTQVAIERISGQTIREINKRIGFRLMTKAGERGAINLVKVVPVLGGVLGGAVDGGMCAVVGNAAKYTFRQPVPVNM